MRAIILAAGIGQRLGMDQGDRPKCLLEFNGSSLLARHVRNLERLGIPALTVVTGYRREDIESHLAELAPALDISTVYNPDFREGSLVSLYSARDATRGDCDVLLMDADVLYDMNILRRLVDTPHANCFLLDRNFIPGEEPVKLCVANGRLVDFRKCIDPDLRCDFQGESVGFFRFTRNVFDELTGRARDYIDRQHRDEPYEELIRDSLLEYPARFSYEDITGLPWLEIDFPEDVRRAEREILPRIEGMTE